MQVLVVGQDLVDTDGEVERRYRLGEADAVLVRPDGHVAWRLASRRPAAASSKPSTTTLGGRSAVTV